MRFFSEEQRFNQPLVFIILIMSSLLVIGITTNEYMSKNSTMKTVDFIIILGTYFVFALPIFFLKLITRIDETGIHYRFFPFHKNTKTIIWSEIKSVRLRKYDAISEYGGWGIKGFFGQKGIAVNVRGNIGIQLEFKHSRRPFLIGTQKENEVSKTLENYKYKLEQI